MSGIELKQTGRDPSTASCDSDAQASSCPTAADALNAVSNPQMRARIKSSLSFCDFGEYYLQTSLRALSTPDVLEATKLHGLRAEELLNYQYLPEQVGLSAGSVGVLLNSICGAPRLGRLLVRECEELNDSQRALLTQRFDAAAAEFHTMAVPDLPRSRNSDTIEYVDRRVELLHDRLQNAARNYSAGNLRGTFDILHAPLDPYTADMIVFRSISAKLLLPPTEENLGAYFKALLKHYDTGFPLYQAESSLDWAPPGIEWIDFSFDGDIFHERYRAFNELRLIFLVGSYTAALRSITGAILSHRMTDDFAAFEALDIQGLPELADTACYLDEIGFGDLSRQLSFFMDDDDVAAIKKVWSI